MPLTKAEGSMGVGDGEREKAVLIMESLDTHNDLEIQTWELFT